jgi:hypothetical protein
MNCSVEIDRRMSVTILYIAADGTIRSRPVYRLDLSSHCVLTNTMKLCNHFFYGTFLNH